MSPTHLKRYNFNLTPRRRQVLWHIAYHGDLRMKMSRNWAMNVKHYMLLPFLAGTEVTRMCNLFQKCRLVRWNKPLGHITITPFGMDVLLNGVPESNLLKPNVL